MTSKFKKDKGNIIFTGEELHVYIPEEFYDRNIIQEMGDHISVFGQLNMRLAKNGSPTGDLRMLNLPTTIDMFPTDLSDFVEMQMTPKSKKARYKIATFYAGDTFTRAAIPKDSTNVELFVKLLTSGNLPPTLKYDEIMKVWQKNLAINSVRLGVPATTMEIMIREIYRDPSNPVQAFALKIGADTTGKVGQLDYVAENIREICALNSTFTGLTFEYFDRMAGAGVLNSTMKRKQNISPVEKIIKM